MSEKFNVSSISRIADTFAGKIFTGQERGQNTEKEDVENFDERPEEERLGLLLRTQELIAERRDLRMGSPEAKNETKFIIKIMNGRRVRVPAVDSDNLSTDLKNQVEQNKETRLQEIKKELEQLGTIPGLREAYKKKVLL
ncbi:TPA: hypothetical protein DEA21_02850, partial [Candidatus Uhrbacteria bacterium]|nr:hypothetical protein [Candidatus Uhrbacteria bacterium]